MKKFCFALFLAFATTGINKAQYVTIPDATFVTWLQGNGFASCMAGSQLDTTCATVLSTTTITCSGIPIRDLSGIKYFKALTYLDCSNDSLYNIPALPNTLHVFNCQQNVLTGVPTMPNGITYFNCGYNQVVSISNLPTGLKQLACNENLLTSIAALPAGLQILNCNFNQLNTLPALPASMQSLSCNNNPIYNLPALPVALQTLSCSADSLSTLPALPTTLTSLNCNQNEITVLPALPAGLTTLQCGTNLLTSLPALPAALVTLFCSQNGLATLPALPAHLTTIACSSNSLVNIPVLPASLQIMECNLNPLQGLPALTGRLQYLDCGYDHLNALPALPSTLNTLKCYGNQLITLPALPAGMVYLDAGNNGLLTSITDLPDSLNTLTLSYCTSLGCLPLLKRIVHFDFTNTAISCLPDYGNISNSSPAINTLPLCGIYNTNSCHFFGNVNGEVFTDYNLNCNFDSSDYGVPCVKAQLYNNGLLQQQTFTGADGLYTFNAANNQAYTLQLDTAELPVSIRCPASRQYAFNLSAADSVSNNNNFAITCNANGFDLGVQSVLNTSANLQANTSFTLKTIAGDLSQLYGLHCAQGISGEVQITYNGPISFTGLATGAISPAINGNTLKWTIADFGTIDILSSFNLIFKVDSNAVNGSSICFTILVTSVTGDANAANNQLNYCALVNNNAKANQKEVSPVANIDTANHWLTYTIRFQNNGNIIAQNIALIDTLDTNLDVSSFQLLNYSAKNMVQIRGNVVVFNFPNINLIQSSVNDSASRGYVQFKIKQLQNLPVGTQIYNTAYVYYDSAAALATNTTLNTVVPDTTTGIDNLFTTAQINIYPNPAHDYAQVVLSENLIGGWLELRDAIGRSITLKPINNSSINLQTNGLTKGIYLVHVWHTGKAEAVKKLVVQ